MSRLSHPTAVIVTSLVLLTAACGDSTETSDAAIDPASAESTTSTVTTESTSTAPAEPETDEPETDEAETEPETDDTETEAEADEPAADLVIDGSFRDGEVVIDDRRFEVERGSSVLISFESDATEHIHLHGYDILVDLVPGQPAELAFVADRPGSYEVELEDSGRFLFELLVR